MAGSARQIQLWDVASQRPLGRLVEAGTASLSDVQFSPDGSAAGRGASDNTCGCGTWLPVARSTRRSQGHTFSVFEVAFSPDGRTLASAGGRLRPLRLWDVRARRQLGAPVQGQRHTVNSVAIQPRRPHGGQRRQ